MSEHINKVIRLLEQGQPAYCVQAAELSYAGGVKMADTWADWIRVGMEHNALDLPALKVFMQGLRDANQAARRRWMPMVSVELPIGGYSEAVIRANAWMLQSVLALGVNAILLAHAEDPRAVKAFVESCRYVFHTPGVGDGLDRGQRGAGGEFVAADIWGITPAEYKKVADVWPLNPAGELALGIKVESRQAAEIADELTAVPGLCFAEWGPADMTASFGYMGSHSRPFPEDVRAARGKVLAATQKAGLRFLHTAYQDDIIDLINEGITLCDPHGEDLEEIVATGKAFTGRKD